MLTILHKVPTVILTCFEKNIAVPDNIAENKRIYDGEQ